MHVLMDVTGLPWAREYYALFPFEPSRKPEDDMQLAKATFIHLEKPTLVDVMRAMIKAAEGGEKEIMLVAHGFEKGLVMRISPSIQFSAEVNTLRHLVVAGEAFELIDEASTLPQNRALLNAWARVAALIAAQGDETKVDDATVTTIANERLGQAKNDIAAACKDLQTRIAALILTDRNSVIRMMKTTEQGLREASELAMRIRAVQFDRIEMRACTIGAGPGIEALRTFFKAKRLMCPVVHTFYVQVNAPNNDRDNLARAAKKAGARFRLFYGLPTAYELEPNRFPRFARPFVDTPKAIVAGELNFMLSVTRMQTPRYASEARRLNADAIRDWVPRYIHHLARHNGTGSFWVGGLDAETPTREPYTLPQDANYRSLIALATPTGVER